MGVEIERKFTVRADFCPQSAGTEMAQGYLSRDPQRTVRVRLAGRARLSDGQGGDARDGACGV